MASRSNFLSQAALAYGAENMPLHCMIGAYVASHEKMAVDLGAGRYDLSEDVVGSEVDDSFDGNTVTLSMLPRRPWTELVFPGDWMSVYFSSGTNAPEGFGVVGMPERMGDEIRVFIGRVSSVRETTNVSKDG